jgi:hypothetical protein
MLNEAFYLLLVLPRDICKEIHSHLEELKRIEFEQQKAIQNDHKKKFIPTLIRINRYVEKYEDWVSWTPFNEHLCGRLIRPGSFSTESDFNWLWISTEYHPIDSYYNRMTKILFQ